MLTVDGVHTYYGESHILQGVSLRVDTGELVAVLGRNGAGKTTTMNSIIGFNRPRAGKVLVNGRDMTGQAPYAMAAAGVGLVPQGRRIFGPLSVKENLELGARSRGPWTLAKIYELFPRLAERQHNRGTSLSGGEQRQLELAIALAGEPKLLLLDEPTAGMSVTETASSVATIGGLPRDLTLLIIEHDMDTVFALADRITVLDHGQVIANGTPAEVRADPQVRAVYLGEDEA